MRLAALLVSLVGAMPLAGQAPQSVDMWRVAAAALARPAALQSGPTAAFWNPAAVPGAADFGAGVSFLQTPDVVSLSAIAGGVHKRIADWGDVGVVVARIEVDDLVRTTTSPLADPGSIPVYEQEIGLHAALRLPRTRLGLMLRGHDSRFDTERETGTTIDVGVRFHPTERLVVAAATHFFPTDFSPDGTTDYYAGIEYMAIRADVWERPASAAVRYGLSHHRSGGAEHAIGVGVDLDGRIGIDAGIVRESGLAGAAWRPALELTLVFGRYRVAVARSDGINELGAAYRFGLGVEVVR
jgi:hypothetical protein